MTTTWNDQILSFFEDGNGKTIISTISVWTRAWPPLFSSNINPLFLSDWAIMDNREMVWKDAESIFQGRRRCRIVRSLICTRKRVLLKLGTDNGEQARETGKWKIGKQNLPWTLALSAISFPILCFVPIFHFPVPCVHSPLSLFPVLVTCHGKHYVEQGNLTHLSWPPKYCIPHIVAKIIKIILESLYHFAVFHAGQVYNCNKTEHSSSACTCRFLSSLCERKRKTKTGNETSTIVQLGGYG